MSEYPFLEIPEELYAEIGCRLLLLQHLESYIGVLVKIVFEDNSEESKKALMKTDKRTMGQLIGALKKKTDIDSNFEGALQRVLDDRNLFVHRLASEFELETSLGQSRSIEFLSKSMGDLEAVNPILQGAIVGYGVENGIDFDYMDSWREHGNLRELETKVIPNLSNYFKKS